MDKKDNSEEMLFQLNKKDIEKFREEGRLEFLSYSTVPDFFAILDKKTYYRKSESGIYYLLPKSSIEK